MEQGAPTTMKGHFFIIYSELQGYKLLKRPNGEAENKRNWKQIIVRNSKINEGHQIFGETDRMREIGG